MNTKEKNLLLMDISARLAYGVKVEIDFYDENGDEYHTGLGTIYQINKDGYFYIEEDDEERNIEFCLPYLYPLQNIQNIIEKHQEEFAFSDKTETPDLYGVINDFYYGAKWADETMLEKACEYLKSLVYQEFGGGPLERTFSDEDIEEFKKAMEE